MSIRATLALIFAMAAAAVLLAAAALFTTLTEMSLLQQRSELSYQDLTLQISLANSVSLYMLETAEISFGTHDPSKLVETAGLVERDLAAVEALKTARNADEELTEEQDEAEGELDSVHRMGASFRRIAANTREVSRIAGADATESHRRFMAVSVQEYEGNFLPYVDMAIWDARRDVARNVQETRQIETRIKVAGTGLTAGALVLLVLLLGGLLRSLDRGMQALTDGARRAAQGELSWRIPDLGKHELGRLGAAFNHMSASLFEAQESKLRVEKLAAVGQLAASVGHDLRNPLGAIRNATHYLKKRLAGTASDADPRIAQFLGLMDKELSTCTRIITDLLDFARERRPLLSACSLEPLVEDALSIIQAPPHVRLENAVQPDLPVPSLDKDQFRQVLVNIIQNAAEAIPADRDGRVTIAAEARGEEMTLSVTDNGSGIPEGNLSQIFEPLFSTKVKGTGLGLAISAGIVRRHGGKIEVASKPGAGTTFIIRIPLVAPTELRSTPTT